MHGHTIHELMDCAQIALHYSKVRKEQAYLCFEEKMFKEITDRHLMENELRTYIKNGNMHVVYQPQVDAMSNEIVGFEALARWKSERFGIVSPVVFIPILEESGLIVPFGVAVFETAIKALLEFNKQSDRELKMSINASSIEFEQPDFIEKIEQVMAGYDIKPHRIEIEVTEGAMIQSFDRVNRKLKKLQELGFDIALDDFGTGYSSLSYIVELALNTLKIDKAFIDTVETDERKRHLLNTITTMAHDLNLKVVAEGVETIEQLNIIRSTGCQVVQGYYYFKPMNKEDVLKQLQLM